jgi:hypothetical protein
MTSTARIFPFIKGDYHVYASSDSSDSDDEDEESTDATSEGDDEDASTSEVGEKSLEEVCDNGIDDNNDGLTDGEDSVSCPQEEQDTQGTQQSSLSDDDDDDDADTNTEKEQQQEEQLDTDSQLREQTPQVEDQLFEDEQVKEVAEEICDDGLDNDGDNLVDIADDECAGPQTQGAATTTPAPTSMTYEEWHNQCIGLAGFGGCPLSPPCNLPPPQNMIETLNYDDNCPDEYQRLQQSQQPQNTGAPAPNEICDNGIDDNNDGLTDGEDLARCPDDDENEEPEAVAVLSGDEVLNIGDSATLDGSQSSDPDGDELTYSWSQTAGPSASISSPTSVSPQFTAPSLDSESETLLTFQLVVSDGKVESEPSTVAITVCPSNSFVNMVTGECEEEEAVDSSSEPVAHAKVTEPSNGLARSDEIVTLDGSQSVDSTGGNALTYSWSQTAGPSASISSPTSVSPHFTAPQIIGFTKLTFRLIVKDTFSQLNQPRLESTDAVDVFVCPSNSTPDPQTESCEYSKIDVRARPIQILENIPTAWHFFIIYTDEKGKDYYYSGGPQADPSNTYDVIGMSTGEYKPGTPDYPDPPKVPEAVSVTVLKGKDKTQGKADCFENELKRISKMNITYYKTGPNSNTVAKTLLKNCNVPDKWPAGVFAVTGWDDRLE